jgi:prephenate dehydrogenase
MTSSETERTDGPGSVAVVGLGLMGGSLVRRLRSVAGVKRLIGVDVDSVRGAAALDEGWLDRFNLPEEGSVRDADLVVLATPLRAALTFMGEEAGALHPDALITDVVGLNEPILSRARTAGLGPRTVTAHPMCGSEMAGPGGSRADLFEGAPIWLSADEEASPGARERIEAFWRAVGGRPRWIDAGEHDRTMAWVSHLPQLVSNALAGALDAAGFRPEDLGPGGRDMTRLAGSSPEIWRDLLAASAPVTGTGLTSVARGLSVLADLLARREVDRIAEFMGMTQSWAQGRREERNALEGEEGEPPAAGLGTSREGEG